ncbi:peptidoglycan-binding domain-containing protein [Streptomyces poriticola]|uniref:peptidoglycan-binding domain-containing protein n=1 Tax=Streptomyces poriticola TaxID=3120506 RepID=UPI002FCE4DF3
MNLRKQLSGVTGAVAVAAGLLAGTVAAAPAAHAAPTCTTAVLKNMGQSYYANQPSTSNWSTSCILSQGSRGYAVEALQRSLRMCVNSWTRNNVVVDGIYGPKTAQAVRYAQAMYGSAVDGVYGPNTRDAMRWWSENYGGGADACRG